VGNNHGLQRGGGKLLADFDLHSYESTIDVSIFTFSCPPILTWVERQHVRTSRLHHPLKGGVYVLIVAYAFQ